MGLLKEQEDAFTSVKQSLVKAPVLALPDADKPFRVVCDASNFAIGSALMQKDDDGVDRVISYRSRLLKAAELNYPVHDKELLSIRYALSTFECTYRASIHLWFIRITHHCGPQ